MEKLERLYKRLDTLDKALSNLEKALSKFVATEKNDELHDLLRESVIKRFEYTLELFWKLIKQYLEEKEGLIVPASPRGVIAQAEQVNLIDSQQNKILNNMIDDRNLSSHAYHEDIAVKIANDVSKYYSTFKIVKDKIAKNIK